MSKDIRTFFTVLSTKKATASDTNKPKKRPVIIESSDEDVIPETPKVKKNEKAVKKRKISSSDDDAKHSSKKLSKRDTKDSIKLKPINISNVFSDAPIKQAPVPEKKQKVVGSPEQPKKGRGKKGVNNKKKGVQTELGIHSDKNFEKSLLDLDDDFLIDNVDELDKTVNESVRMELEVKEEENDKKLEKTPKKAVNNKLHKNDSTPKTPKAKKEIEHSESDPDQERYERKRQSAVLYQKYLNRSGPAHHGSKELPKGKPDCLKNICFLRTGVLDSLENSEFETLITDHGGRVVHSVSKKVNYIVVGEDAGPAKLEKAKNYEIKLITEDELLDLIKVKSGIAKVTQPDAEEIIKKKSKKDETPKSSTTSSPQKSEKKLVKTEPIKKTAKVESQVHTKQQTNEKAEKVIEKKLNKDETPKPSTASTPQKSEKNVIKTEPIKKTVKVETQVFTKPQINENNNNLSWTDKYKPKSVKNIIGQQTDKSNMKKLLHWLENWFKNHGSKNKPKLTKPSPWAKSDDGAYFKAALLSGPPGIGKTTTATLVAKELGFDVVEFNASDTRSKRLLHEEVSQLLSTKSLAGYFNGGDAPSSKHVLLMDEVDGMAGNEDRGGVQELIALIKNSNIPVICMCNDRNHPKIRSLSNYCFDLRFVRPKLEQIKGAMMSVCFKEGVKINSETLTEIINSAGMDIRQVLTHLSLWTADENGNEDIKGPKKDSPLGAWEVCRRVFSAEEQKTSTISDRERLFFFDYSIAPLFVQENYLNVMPRAPKKDHLKLFAEAANSISMGDVVDSKIRQSNNWSLLNVEAMCYSVLPGTLLSGHVNARIDFPSWLGKNSKKNKFTRLLGELQAHMRTSISANRSEVNLDYISPVRRGITEPLAKKGSDGIDEALEVMHAYNLLREDLDSILELAQWPRQKDPMNMVESKVKAAFTRSYNKSSAMLPYAINSNISKKKGTTINEGGEYGLSEEEEEDNSESDEKDITKDAMIKAKKATAKGAKKDEPATSANKRGSKGGTGRAPKKMKK